MTRESRLWGDGTPELTSGRKNIGQPEEQKIPEFGMSKTIIRQLRKFKLKNVLITASHYIFRN